MSITKHLLSSVIAYVLTESAHIVIIIIHQFRHEVEGRDYTWTRRPLGGLVRPPGQAQLMATNQVIAPKHSLNNDSELSKLQLFLA